MFRERTTSYLRHLHLVVHSAQQRLRLPVYVIQREEEPLPRLSPLKVLDKSAEDTPVIYRQKKAFSLYFCVPLLLVASGLIAAIALLSSWLATKNQMIQCPTYDCSWANSTATVPDNLDVTSEMSFPTDWETSTSSNATTSEKELLYGVHCMDHQECALSRSLFCEYEFDLQQKRCFCETSYVWNKHTQQCEPKKVLSAMCEYDNECRLDLGITCDPGADAARRCRCMGEQYWTKMSNCGALKIEDFVQCIDELYISSCLVKEVDGGVYHNVNIRQIQGDEIQFDYFILDSPEIQELERVECAWAAEKRYCFGVDNESNRLLIFITDKTGIESYHSINQSVIGLPNALAQPDGTVVCYVETNDSNLISITIDPNNNQSLTVQQRAGKTYGERSCFIAINRTTYCFYRDADHRLTAVIMNDTMAMQDAYINVHSDTNLKTGPSCGWVGTINLLKLFCFAVFNDEKIHWIEQIEGRWSDWMIMPSDKLFIQRPLFVTSKLPDDVSAAQSCHVLAIDTSNEVYVSSNTNCTYEDSFSPWSVLHTDVGLLSFNGSFRLRDGRLGVYGIGIDDLPYYTTMDPTTHLFEPIKLAVSTE